MATNLNISLSTALKTELGQPGVWAYALYFDPTTKLPVFTDMVDNGVVQNGGSYTIVQPASVSGGKTYFLTQSLVPGSHDATNDLTKLITAQADINWNSAAALDYSYDSIEYSLLSAPGDAGNLTAVNGFGMPIEISVPYSNGTTATVGFGVTGAAIAADINAIDPGKTNANFTLGPLGTANLFRESISPTVSVSQADPPPPAPPVPRPFLASDWNSYVQSLEGPQASKITLSGTFLGAAEGTGLPWHNGGYFAYQLSWNATDHAFWLLAQPTSVIQGDIRITDTSLENSIYSTLGAVDVYKRGPGGTETVYYADMNTGKNNQWGNVLTSFLTGFTGGFYGATGNSINPQDKTPVDLDNNINWDPNYAFGQNLQPPSAPVSGIAFDAYSQVFYDHSNSYGSSYSDALMSKYSVGGPLIQLSEPGVTPAVNVPNINVTLFSGAETPAGYVTPAINDYIAPTANGYLVPDALGAAGTNVELNFYLGVTNSVGVVIAQTAKITLSILTAWDKVAGPTWTTVTLDGAAGVAGPNGLWQVWNLAYDAAAKTYSATPSGIAKPQGDLILGGFPVASSGTGPSWYQVAVGGKTYNLYTTTINGSFENPNYPGQGAALAVDGLASISPPSGSGQTITTFKVGFVDNTTVSYDPSSVVTANSYTAALPAPNAPVALDGATLVALPGQTAQITNSISTNVFVEAFGWTGTNNNPGTAGWITKYTNLVDGSTVARVTLHSMTAGTDLTATATATIDGQWTTGLVQLAKDTYTVTFQEFAATDTGFTTPLSARSSALTLSVACFAQGTGIETEFGTVAVEDLRAGDRVRTRSGRLAAIAWLGHRRVACDRHPKPVDVWPVRVAAHAFGPDAPQQDLLLSPDHAVFVDGVLIPVRYLLNGASIRQEQAARITYWHVELDRHDVLLAEGLPCESYLDTGNRSAFVEGGAAIALHPDFALRVWDARACAKLVRDGAELRAVRSFLLERAALLGHAGTADPDLRLVSFGREIKPTLRGGAWRFRAPGPAREWRLVSRSAVPGEVRADSSDHRRLGVAVAAIACNGQPIPLTELGSGWHAPEAGWRWTDGNAAIALPADATLDIRVAMTERYWVQPAA